MRRLWEVQTPQLAGKSIIILGGTGGLGAEICKVAALEGAQVLVADRDGVKCARLAKELPNSNAGHAPIEIDLAEDECATGLITNVKQVTKELHGLVNAAGVTEDFLFPMLPADAIRRMMQVNLIGGLAVAQASAKLMRKTGGGAIVNITSTTGLDGNEGQVAYGASKAALTNATQTMAMELAKWGIRVNAVAPGVIDTPMTRKLSPVDLDRLVARTHMGRIGTKSEVAGPVVWLLSSKSSYVTGQTLRVDGCM